MVVLHPQQNTVEWLIYQPDQQKSFKIIVLRNGLHDGHTYEGMWQGDGTPVKGVNPLLNTWDAKIYLGQLPPAP